jgi:hypothetical protein
MDEVSEVSDGLADRKGRVFRSDDKKSFKRTATMIWSKICDHKYGPSFMKTTKDEKNANYLDIIKRPMNLTVIKNRIRDGVSFQSLEYTFFVM